VFLIAVKIAAFYPLLEFQRNIGRLVHHVKSSPPAPGLPEVLVPGELEAKTKRHRLREGIPVEPATWEVLQQILDRFHLAIEVS
jgi:ureidoglycolate dehydrogenase (NAD+)